MQKDLKEQQAIREKLLNNRELTIEPLVTVEESKMNTINNPPANEENQFLDLQEKFIRDASSRFSEQSIREFLAEQSLPEMNFKLFVEAMKNRENYTNNLRFCAKTHEMNDDDKNLISINMNQLGKVEGGGS